MAYAVRYESERDRLHRELELEHELARRRAADPLGSMSWLPAQAALLRSTRKRKLLRAGQQSTGKTTAGIAECLYRAIGKHPYKQVPRGPTWQWAVGPTERQSGIMQRKLWELCPREWLHPDSPAYNANKGAFEGRFPRVVFRNGSWVEFRTGGGDLLNLAADKLHHVLCDEPLESERAFNELQKRVLRTGGDVTLTFTPVNRPVEWVRKKAEAGLIEDLHYDLRPEHMVFETGPLAGRVITLDDGTPCDQTWIDVLIAETSDMEIPVTIHGGWEFRHEGYYYAKVWDPLRMITDRPPNVEYELVVGIDFGDRPGKQIVLLIAVDEHNGGTGWPYVHVLDEYIAVTGRETPDDDAQGTLRMLVRNQTTWADLKFAGADRTHKAGRGDQKSGPDMQAALAKRMGIEFGHVEPSIRVVKRGKGRGSGSVHTRSKWLHQQMSRGNFSVHPRCARLLSAIPKYKGPFGHEGDEAKDPIDALVYGLDRYIYASNPRLSTRNGPRLAW